MAKVKCRICSNELSGLCSVKKIGVKTNKPRICNNFIYDESKIKIHKEIPTIKFGYKEKQEAKMKRKEEIKRLRQELSNKNPNTLKNIDAVASTNMKYPLTGDLSRFISSASSTGESNDG